VKRNTSFLLKYLHLLIFPKVHFHLYLFISICMQPTTTTTITTTTTAPPTCQQRRSISVDADVSVFSKYDSNSNDDESEDEPTFVSKDTRLLQRRGQQHMGYAKSHLRLVYEWLRGLYVTQMTRARLPDLYMVTRSNSVYNKTTAFQRLPSAGASLIQNPSATGRDGKSWFNHDLINPFVID